MLSAGLTSVAGALYAMMFGFVDPESGLGILISVKMLIMAALGGAGDLSPFFRIPGLLRQDSVEEYLATRGLMIWSADVPSDDWKRRILEQALDAARQGLMGLTAR